MGMCPACHEVAKKLTVSDIHQRRQKNFENRIFFSTFARITLKK
jgi:hypothetical protein